ncbi:bifunctional folylpolyglutamate synthase/dihydrofolate synthase [Candidatus Gottesmanbacteria bacterium]|nr:bifunctional folylpolyglutamate synthase/dihydrofolate synthase [Candidatus Gottesmanbacteria bacterium]
MIRTFPQAVKFLESFTPAPREKFLGPIALKRMQYLAEIMGSSQFSYPTIHVGGTSGKGSTATIIASILATKYKVGLNTSPHLEKISERIKINGADISDTDFIGLINELIPYIEKMKISKYGKPSTFEITIAGAFLYFKKKKVDVAVFEVGLGGAYDGTNVIRPEVAILTNVGLDHTEILGGTVEKIAKDKVGIIKPGIQVISGVKQASVKKIVQEKCKRQNAKLSLLGRDFNYQIKDMSENGSTFDYFGEKNYRSLSLPLLGEHQIENAALAIRAIEKLSNYPIIPASPVGRQSTNQPIKIANKEIRKGLKSAFIPGRMEVVRKNPLVILDGAHNTDKVQALVKAFGDIYPGKKTIFLVAIKSDKNAKEMLKLITPISKKIIFTEFSMMRDQGKIESYNVAILKTMVRVLKFKGDITAFKDIQEAVRQALSLAKKDDLILVTGSLYLVGEVRREIMNYKV